VNRTVVHPREVFRRAIFDNAVGIIAAHNHPSGQLRASEEDTEVCDMLKEASRTVGIHLVDFVILSREGVYSFKKEKLLFDN
jgi:DNA repair protein RadC